MALVGMDRDTGLPLSGVERVKKSITDILTTPVGSRVERPDYGSRLRRLVDLPITKGWLSAAQAEVARAVSRWEPEFKLLRVTVTEVIDGRIGMTLQGAYQGQDVTLEVNA